MRHTAPASLRRFAQPASPATIAVRRTLTLIVPVYHEGENFPRLVAEIERHVAPPRRMIVVYDTDDDGTLPVARRLAASRTWIELAKNAEGRGVVGAIRTGFSLAGDGPALVTMADLSDDLRIVSQMLTLYEQGCRVVCASRYMRGGRQEGGPLVKRLLSRAAGLSLRWLFRFPTHDATNNFRLYDAALVRELRIESQGGFELALELTAKAHRSGAPISELPTTWRDRTAGKSNFHLRKWLPHYLRWYWYAAAGRWRAVAPSPTTQAEHGTRAAA
jgi:glycosyltransferase involved in cell wall biosynthesis